MTADSAPASGNPVQACRVDDEFATQRVVLDVLVLSYPAPWTVVELARFVVGQPLDAGKVEPRIESVQDALRDLYGAGLVHSLSGAMYIASRAAVEGQRLYNDDAEPPQL